MNWWRAFGWFLVAVCLVCAFGIYQTIRQANEYTQACEKLGGVPLRLKGGYVCLNPDAVL